MTHPESDASRTSETSENSELAALDETERAVVELIDAQLQWGDRSDPERAAFAAQVFERVEARPRRWDPVWVSAVVLAALLAVLAVWPRGSSESTPLRVVADRSTAALSSSAGSFLSVAYYAESGGDSLLDSGSDENDYLPERYRAWSDALELVDEHENGAS